MRLITTAFRKTRLLLFILLSSIGFAISINFLVSKEETSFAIRGPASAQNGERDFEDLLRAFEENPVRLAIRDRVDPKVVEKVDSNFFDNSSGPLTTKALLNNLYDRPISLKRWKLLEKELSSPSEAEEVQDAHNRQILARLHQIENEEARLHEGLINWLNIAASVSAFVLGLFATNGISYFCKAQLGWREAA